MSGRIHLSHSAGALWKKTALIVLAIVLFQLFFVILASSTELKAEIMKDIGEVPEVVQKIFGKGFIDAMIKYGVLAIGYVHPFIYFLYILFIFLAVSQTVMSGISSGTIGFLLSRPVSRTRIFLNMTIIIFTGLALLVLSSYLATSLGVMVFSGGGMSTGPFLPIAANLFLLMFFIGGYIAVIAAVSHSSRSMYTRSGILIFAFYLINLVTPLWKPLKYIAVINPFNYFNPLEILSGRKLSLIAGFAVFFLSVALYTAASRMFNRRDIFSG
jgi:ABC-2 type transport system permease protein